MPDDDKWRSYFDRLARFARKKLASPPLGAKNDEDIASSTIKSFLRGYERTVAAGEDDFDLWPILATIAARKCANLIVYSKAKKRDVSRLKAAELDEVVCTQPGPRSQAEQEESRRLLLEILDGHSRQIALWKMERYTNSEIATKLGCAERSVEREVKLIKCLWDEHVQRVWNDAGQPGEPSEAESNSES
jgi:DNA-directed RNA polymerase specialized sigma24 family protein